MRIRSLVAVLSLYVLVVYTGGPKGNDSKPNPGTIEDRGHFVLSEFGAKGEKTGIFAGRFSSESTSVGRWFDPDGRKKKPFTLEESALAGSAPFISETNRIEWFKKNCVQLDHDDKRCEVISFKPLASLGDQDFYVARYSFEGSASPKESDTTYGFVIFERKHKAKKLRPIWAAVSEPGISDIAAPEVVKTRHGYILSIPVAISGTGGIIEDQLYVWKRNQWVALDWTSWVSTIPLPKGHEVRLHRLDLGTWEFASPVRRESDCNACASGGDIVVKLGLEDDKIVVKDYKYNPSTILDIYHAGDVDLLSHMAANGADLNVRDSEGSTTLLYAAADGNERVVEMLLKAGADVKAGNKLGETALSRAAANGHLKVVEALLAYGAAINATDSYGSTALIKAVEGGHAPVAKLLLDKGADCNVTDCCRPALIRATIDRKKELVELLAAGDCDTNIKDKYGRTALIHAAKERDGEIARVLLARGARMDEKDEHGHTALMEAAEEGYIEIVKQLLMRSADVNAKTSWNYTPLMLAAAKGHKEVVNLLLASGANVNVKGKDGFTALMQAQKNGHTEIVTILKQAGAKE